MMTDSEKPDYLTICASLIVLLGMLCLIIWVGLVNRGLFLPEYHACIQAVIYERRNLMAFFDFFMPFVDCVLVPMIIDWIARF